jgi:hypothetical protein
MDAVSLYCNYCDDCLPANRFMICRVCKDHIKPKKKKDGCDCGFLCKEHTGRNFITYNHDNFFLCNFCMPLFDMGDPEILEHLK